jgi:hypothetical protein
MSITMTFNANDAFELKTILETIATAFVPQKAVTSNGKEGEKILQSVAAPAVTEKAVTQKSPVEKVQETPTAEAPVKSISEVMIEQCRAAVNARKDTHREEIKATLEEFGASKIPDLKPEQYRDFLTKIEALV